MFIFEIFLLRRLVPTPTLGFRSIFYYRDGYQSISYRAINLCLHGPDLHLSEGDSDPDNAPSGSPPAVTVPSVPVGSKTFVREPPATEVLRRARSVACLVVVAVVGREIRHVLTAKVI